MGRFGPACAWSTEFTRECLLYRSCRFPHRRAIPPCCSGLTRGNWLVDDLFRRHRSVAYRVAYRLLGAGSGRATLVQNGFVKALTHLERFGGRSSFKTWLLRIISNAALDLGRQRQRDARIGQAPLDDRPDRYGPTECRCPIRISAPSRETIIDRALDRLPESQRQTFVLHVDGELSYRQIADAMGISIGTVMSRCITCARETQIATRGSSGTMTAPTPDDLPRELLAAYADGELDGPSA